jgi:hypothetical protein
MLKIGAEPLAAFGRAAIADFEARMLAHLKRFSPRHPRIVGDPELLGLVEIGSKRAGVHGFTSERSVRVYIELALMFGLGFDADPQHPWAGEPLRADDDEHLRADRLAAAAWAHIDDTAADDPSPAAPDPRRASARLLRFAQEPERAPSEPAAWDLRVRLLARLRREFPGKWRHIGEPALARCVEHAVATARSFGFLGERGQSVFTGLSVVLGAEYYDDPQFSWAKQALTDRALVGEPARTRKLLDGAVDCLDRFWAEEG